MAMYVDSSGSSGTEAKSEQTKVCINTAVKYYLGFKLPKCFR